MMRSVGKVGALVLAVALVPLAFGQTPQVESVDWQIARYSATRELAQVSQFGSIFGLWTFADLWDDPVPFNPDVDVAAELDILIVDMVVFDSDLLDVTDPNDMNDKFFHRVRAFPLLPGPPEPPPLYGLTNAYQQLEPTLLDPAEFGPGHVFLSFVLQIPRLSGANQDRLRGIIDYDVAWAVEIRVSNEEDPQEDSGAYDVWEQVLFAIQSTLLAAPNPPPVADAGGDQIVEVGTTVVLDGSRSFDGSNIGFDSLDPNILEKDTLTYSWTWIDGPERVDPEPDPSAPAGLGPGQWPRAVVTLEVANTDAKPFYIYRLVVDDGVNPPSADEVRIQVVPQVRANRPPTAVITDATGQLVTNGLISARVGDQVRLSAALSSDPDGDPLAFHWRQTNEVGGALIPDEVASDFQPLSGVAESVVSWQTTRTGTFYFNLLVTDEPPAGLMPLSSSANVTVDVSEAAAASEIVSRQSGDTPEAAEANPPPAPAACGAGALLPLALATLGVCLARSRRR